MPVRCQLGLPLLLLRQMEVSMSTATHEAVRRGLTGRSRFGWMRRRLSGLSVLRLRIVGR